MGQQTALQKAIEEIKNMAGAFEHQRIPAVLLLSKIIPLLEDEKEQLENARPQITSNCVIKEIADEDIKRKIKKEYNYTHYEDRLWMVQGAVWYREQLKKQQ